MEIVRFVMNEADQHLVENIQSFFLNNPTYVEKHWPGIHTEKRIIEKRFDDNIQVHYLFGLCSTASHLFLLSCGHPQDFQSYKHTGVIRYQVGERIFDWKTNHTWLRDKTTGEIIDITSSQFPGMAFPYELGESYEITAT